MRIQICAVGRLRQGPEADLIRDYLGRFERIGRGCGFRGVTIVEVETKKTGGPMSEAKLLINAVPAGALIVALDERGQTIESPEFAGKLAKWRDGGQQDVAFIIGGADGLSRAVRQQADLVLSLGAMVWPHMLVRVMLAEQLYRAASILAGTPYHRA